MRGFGDRVIAFVFAVGMLVGGAGIGHAGPYEDALAGFTTDEFSDTADAVTAVATSGSPLAPALIAALQDGRLQFSAKDKKVFIKTADDKLVDAETGKPFEGTPPDDIDTVRVNNRLRGVIDAANGALTLMAPNPNRRYEAAQAVFKRR
jgi:urea transport system permease protein